LVPSISIQVEEAAYAFWTPARPAHTGEQTSDKQSMIITMKSAAAERQLLVDIFMMDPSARKGTVPGWGI
jgi:hypothetical protein